jgi:hypothetical protein
LPDPLHILPPPVHADANAAALWLDADAPLVCAALRAAQVIASTPAERVAVGAALADLGQLVEHAARVASRSSRRCLPRVRSARVLLRSRERAA